MDMTALRIRFIIVRIIEYRADFIRILVPVHKSLLVSLESYITIL